ncbi:MAG TPA: cation-translocating P-type ATPase [Candidatus Paceibacterota bacterium]|nr:cation-translocating P-type ATPase [Candidatus Paceibacterota bacterium]
MVLDLEQDRIKGLTEKEVVRRIKSDGYNEIESSKRDGFFLLLIKVLKEPMFFLLIASGIIYLFLGDNKEAIILLSCVVIIVTITVYQENKTEKTLEALRDLSSPRAVVIRNGEKKRIAGREVVRGDILILSEGERVPADAIILSCSNMKVDESLLTGESVPVRKTESRDTSKISSPGGEDLPFIYSGTLVVSGTCIAEVIRTGMNTEMGKIGKSLKVLTVEKTPLQKEVASIVKYFAIWGLFLCGLVVVIYALTRDGWLHGLLTGLTLAMSVLPEEFPVVLTVFLALGAWRMSKKKVLARRQHAIQSLGSATVLCVDKTGTLTLNRMTIKKIYSNSKTLDLSKSKLDDSFHELIETSILASQKDPFDPMEKAIKNLSKEVKFEHNFSSLKLIKEFPLTKEILATSSVWESDKKEIFVATKGAPESIFSLCHLNSSEKTKLLKEVEKMASEGLRVIGVAKSSIKNLDHEDKVDMFNYRFIGLIGFEDPIRPGVASAIKECYNAGIKVMMITGDYPVTAKNIGLQIGLVKCDVITGEELDKMKDSELKKRISNVCIFARVVPEQKLRIVAALKAKGEIVVMTGDGVNDAPALKSAHVGIAMGMRGTDVAREASGMVILDDDFSSIVEGVKTGRRIFDNIRKAMGYLFAVHFPIAGITLLALIFGWPLILLPAHIVFLELIIDPTCSIVFEAVNEEKNIMNRKPRNPKERIFNKKTIILSALQGIIILILTAILFKLSVFMGKTEFTSRAIAFSTLIIGNLGLILSNLSWKESVFSVIKLKNKALIYVFTGALAFLLLTIYVPYLNDIFKFDPLGLKDWGMILLSGIIVVLLFETTEKIVGMK